MIASSSASAVHEHQRVADLAGSSAAWLTLDDVERADARGALDDEERHDHADEQPDVAGAGGEERLQRGVGVGLLLPPVPDQHERAQTDELPADEQLQRVVGDDEQQHRRGEQRRAPRRSACSGGRRACTRASRRARAARSSVTTNIIITASPSIWMPAVRLHAAVLEPRDVVHDRAAPAPRRRPRRRGGRCCARARRARRRRAPSASWTRLIHWHERAAREHERRADRDDADLGTVPRHPLAEKQDHDERQRRDQRDQPRVVEEEHRRPQPFIVSTSSRSALCRLR